MVFSALRPSDRDLERHYGGYSRDDYDSPITRQRYREMLQRFVPHRQTNRILDIGCGIGYFLEEACDAGWQAHGTEYGARAVAINRAKGLDVVDASAGFDVFEAGSFDVVTGFELMEHVLDPRHMADQIARLLRPGGVLYCTTPNFDSLSRRVFRERWTVIDYPEHLNYFTTKTLRRLFESVGLRAASVRSTGLSLSRVREAVRVARPRDVSVASLDEQVREQIERSWMLTLAKRTADGSLVAMRAGDTLKGWFVRAADPAAHHPPNDG